MTGNGKHLGATEKLQPEAVGGTRRAWLQFHDNFLRVLIEYPFLLWICLVALLAELGAAILNIATLPFHLDFDLRAAWATGWVIASFLFVEAAFKSPFGALSDRIGRRPLMFVGPLWSALCCCVMFYLNQAWQFIIVHGLNGMGYAAFWPACYSSIADRVRKKDMNTAMSVFNLAYMLGVALGPLAKSLVGNQDLRVELINRLVERALKAGQATGHVHRLLRHPFRHFYDVTAIRAHVVARVMRMNEYDVMQRAGAMHLSNEHRFPFFLVAGLFILTSIMVLFIVPSGRPKPLEEEVGEEAAEDAANEGAGGATVPVNPHAASGLGILEQIKIGFRTIPWMMAIAFCIFMGIGFLTPCLMPYAVKVYNVTERTFSVMLLPVAALIGVLALPLGRLGDRWGSSRSIRLGMVICTVGMWLVALQPMARHLHNSMHVLGSIWLMVPVMATVGVGFVMANPAWMARINDMAPDDLRGAVMGAAAMAQGAGALIGGVVGGHLWAEVQHTSFPEAPVFACAALLTAGTLLTLWHVRAPRDS